MLLPSLIVLLLTTASDPVSGDAVPSASCVACKVNVATYRTAYSDDVWAKMDGGEIVTSKVDERAADGSVQSQMETATVVDRPAEQVWDVIVDFGSRPKYMPDCREIKTTRSEGNKLWLAEHLKVFFLDIRYTTIATVDTANGSVVFAMDKSEPHDIANTAGSWQIAPFDGGRRTFVRYRLQVETGKPVPGIVEEYMTARSLPKMVGNLRDEVEKRYPEIAAAK